MELPPYFLARPSLALSAETRAAFSDLYREAVLPGRGGSVVYTLRAPRWQFLCWLCETQEVLAHGSGNLAIGEFEPRQSNDVHAFGNRRAVYAASDGIWPLYFAIVDRGVARSLINACFRVVEADGRLREPRYFFSVDGEALRQQPWRHGTVYILPRAGFEQQPREVYRGVEVEVAQWARAVPVRPLAQLPVGPEDFPFLTQVRAHDIATTSERAARAPLDFPWLDE